MKEEVTLEKRDKDRIEQMIENEHGVSIFYNDRSGNIHKIDVPQYMIDFVKDYIDSFNVGEKHKSSDLYSTYLRTFKIKSNISLKKLQIVKKTMEECGFDKIRIGYVIESLEDNEEFSLMDYKEFIGSRKTNQAQYFKLWAALRYWAEKKIILYNMRGSITRTI